MNTVIIGDVHNRVDLVCKILNRHQNSQFIFIGDYFDSFTDDVAVAKHTAMWLKDSLQQSNRIHLWGNHDVQYAFGMANLRVTGYTRDKEEIISEVMTHEDWSRLKFFHAQDDWWFSHAGITAQWFEHPVHGLTQSSIEREIKLAERDLASRRLPMSLCSYDDMGDNPAGIGGLLWVRWNRLDCIPGVKQIVGHTQCERVSYKRDTGGTNINIDCLHKEYVVINDSNEVVVVSTQTGETTTTLQC